MKRAVYLLGIVFLLSIFFFTCAIADDDADTESPKISNVEVQNIGETWFIVDWETDEPAVGEVEWGLTDQYGNAEKEGGTLTREHQLKVEGLEKNTNYYVRISATDAAGNTGYHSLELGTFPQGSDSDGGSNTMFYVWIAVGTVVFIIIIIVIYEIVT